MAVTIYPNTPANLATARATPDAHVLIHGAKIIVSTGADKPGVPVPAAVTARQIRLAMNAQGLRTAVEAAVAAGSQDLKDWWEFSAEVHRAHPLVAQVATALNKSGDQVDALFRLAATL